VCSTSTPLPLLNPHLTNAGLAWPYITRMKSSQVCLSTQEWILQTCQFLGHPPIYDAAPNSLFGISDLLQTILTDVYERFLFSLFLTFSSCQYLFGIFSFFFWCCIRHGVCWLFPLFFFSFRLLYPRIGLSQHVMATWLLGGP
jgi:hypothetical protein